MSEQSIAGRRVFVTGGSSGIGRACALAFADAGAEVSITALDDAALSAMAGHELPGGRRLRCFGGDLTDDAFLARIGEEAARSDILVNVAGVAVAAPFLDNDPAHWDLMFAVNVRATMRLSLAAARGMVARGSGHIITITSALAHKVSPNTLGYAATKHALSALHQGMRLELLGKGVRSTEIRPGLVADTNFGHGNTHPAVRDHKTGRPYQGIAAEDVARAVLYAATTPPNVEVDVLEVKPLGQL
jgi:3-hydroxy acid dehydrogenase/malonic semialdehyde reductase